MNTKLAFLDCETSGTNPYKHSIWQIAMILEINGEVVEEFNSTLKPTGEIDPNVPNIESLTAEAIEKYPLSSETFASFKSVLAKHIDPYDKRDKAFFLGYNARFDADFVRQWFYKEGDKFFGSWFWGFPIIDVAVLAGLKLMQERPKMSNFQLGTVCQQAGLEWDEEQAHDALFDIRKTRALYHKSR